MATETLYLYCLAPPGKEAGFGGNDLPQLLGPVFELDLGGLTAIVSRLEDADEWADDRRLGTLDWVTPRALHHARVIEQVWQSRPVYPARFGTLFTSVQPLQEMVRKHEDALQDYFGLIEGGAEWGVKVFFDPEEAEARWIAEQIDGDAEQLDALPAGRRYLAEQRLRREAKKSLAPRLEAVCHELARRLIHQPDGLRERALPPEEDPKRRPLAHWAFLWPLSQKAELEHRLGEAVLAAEQSALQLQWTGPWPPYSFRPSLDVGGSC
jgi:hypothetical protein